MNFLKQNLISIAIFFLGFCILILSYTVAIGFEKLDNDNDFLIKDCSQYSVESSKLACELSNSAIRKIRKGYFYNFSSFVKELFKGLK